MNPASADIRVWILAGIVAALLPCLGYLLIREFARKDALSQELHQLTERWTGSINELNKVISQLSVSLEELRSWSLERFISRREHGDAMKAVREEIADLRSQK